MVSKECAFPPASLRTSSQNHTVTVSQVVYLQLTASNGKIFHNEVELKRFVYAKEYWIDKDDYTLKKMTQAMDNSQMDKKLP